MSEKQNKTITFIQYAAPPLQSGEYCITVEQTVNQVSQNSFSTSRRFAVTGERFSFKADAIHSVFPKNMANGEFAGVLPHVVFNRRTIPWERSCSGTRADCPWLALLLFNEKEKPELHQGAVKDLIKQKEPIAVKGSDQPPIVSGTMPEGWISYPKLNPLDYGEVPDAPCAYIDIPVRVFNQIAPSIEDLALLAHVREVDTMDSDDNTAAILNHAVVIGNRIPLTNATSYVFLVSLENMENVLPDRNGTPGAGIPDGASYIRLNTYYCWSFGVNAHGDTFQRLLEDLNRRAAGSDRKTTSLKCSYEGAPPAPGQVEMALNHQSNGQLTAADAQLLIQNALEMGYMPLDHDLRHAGNTVSWYRGPLVPYAVVTTLSVPISCPDAANRYDPQTGMFDISYGAAWQLGQLLALQNKSYSITLYNWKKNLKHAEAVTEESRLIQQRLGGVKLLESILTPRLTTLDETMPEIPGQVAKWLGRLKLLYGVPFHYLVPDERMLPVEALRFFYLDFNWIEALVDGAFSIGRVTTGQLQRDAEHCESVRGLSWDAACRHRPNPRLTTSYTNETQLVTGFLMRSQVVSGWPRLDVNGYADAAGSMEIPKLRMERIAHDVLLCLFDGVVRTMTVSEAPEQLHSGVELKNDVCTVALRELTGAKPGTQYSAGAHGESPDAVIPVRGDRQTLQIAKGAQNIKAKLEKDFGQVIASFTSEELALEMVKGVVKVKYQAAN